MTATARLTSPITIDNPVWTRKIVFAFEAGDNARIFQDITHNGILQRVIIVCSLSVGEIRGQVRIRDDAGIEVFIADDLSPVTPIHRHLHEPLAGTFNVSAKPIGVVAAPYTITVYLRGIV